MSRTSHQIIKFFNSLFLSKDVQKPHIHLSSFISHHQSGRFGKVAISEIR